MLPVVQDRQWALSRHLAMKVIPGIPFPYALCTDCALSWATFLAARYSQCTLCIASVAYEYSVMQRHFTAWSGSLC